MSEDFKEVDLGPLQGSGLRKLRLTTSAALRFLTDVMGKERTSRICRGKGIDNTGGGFQRPDFNNPDIWVGDIDDDEMTTIVSYVSGR